MKIHRDRRNDAARRQRMPQVAMSPGHGCGLPGAIRTRASRRFAVGRGRRLGASSTSDGYPDPPFGALLPSHLPQPIPATSVHESGPSCSYKSRQL